MRFLFNRRNCSALSGLGANRARRNPGRRSFLAPPLYIRFPMGAISGNRGVSTGERMGADPAQATPLIEPALQQDHYGSLLGL